VSASDGSPEAGSGHRPKVFLVGAGPGAADLITLRGLRALQQAQCVIHDDLVHPSLYADLGVELVDVGKRSGNHKMKQDDINAVMVALAGRYERIVRLKGGDPFVLGRGSEEVAYLAAHGVDSEVIPGVTSAVAAPAAAGIPVTHRGIADSFCVVSAHPRDPSKAMTLPAFDAKRTLVLLMGVHTMPVWREKLLGLGYPRDLPVAFVRWGGRPDQEVYRSTLGAAIQLVGTVKSPTVAVVGHVVGVATRTGAPQV